MRADNKPYGCLATLIGVAVHRYRSWIGLSIFSLPQEFGWHFLVEWKLVLSEKAFRSDPAQLLWVLYLRWSLVILAIDTNLHLGGGGQPGAMAISITVWRVSWISVTNYEKKSPNTLLLEFSFANLCLWVVNKLFNSHPPYFVYMQLAIFFSAWNQTRGLHTKP